MNRKGLALISAILITGCSGTASSPAATTAPTAAPGATEAASPAPEASPSAAVKRVKIASLVQPADNPWVQNNIKFQQQVADALGIDLSIVSDQGTDDSNVAAMRGLIAQQPDGILFDPISQAAGQQDAALLEQYKVIGVTEDRLVVPNIADYKGDYLKAQVTQDNIQWGYNTMKSLINQGAKKIVTILPPHGILTVELIWVGALKALAEHPEVTVVQETWTAKQSREDGIQAMQTYLAKYGPGEIDGVIAIGSTMALGAVYAIKQAGRQDGIQVATADDDKDVIAALKNGDLNVTWGTHWTNGGWGLITLYDILQGFTPQNRQPQFNLLFINKDNADAYNARFLQADVLTADQIRSLSQAYNPDADLPSFMANLYQTWNK